jgi:hypothetical protein
MAHCPVVGPGLFAPEHSVLDRESWDCRSPFTQLSTLKLHCKELLLMRAVEGDVMQISVDGVPLGKLKSEGFAHPVKRWLSFGR